MSSPIRNLKRASIFDNLNSDFNQLHHNEDGSYDYLNADGLTREEYMAEATDDANRLDAIGAVYQRADRIITGESELGVTVSMSKDMEVPSLTDGRDIIINGRDIGEINDDTIIGLNGLNYHELAHVLFSPRAGSALGQYVRDESALKAFNLLEEGRIERLITTLYPTVTPTLEAMTSTHVLGTNPESWGDQYITITGRTYLPLELRQAVADKFIGKYGVALAQEVHGIVHEYRGLSFPTEFGRAKELIAQLTNLIGKDNEATPEWGKDSHGERMIPEKGRPKSGKEQASLQERAKATDGDKENLSGDSQQFGLGSGGDGTTVYDGEDRKLSEQEQKVADAISQRLKELKNDKRMKRDVAETRKAILGNSDVNVKLPRQSTVENKVSLNALNYARKFGRELERMVRDQDPKWDTHLPSGKLNISRTMNPDVNAIGEMFDVWDTGNDSTDIEASILIDNSGSMWGLMSTVCEQAWIIKRGIESIDGSVSVYNFSSEAKVMYDRDEKAKPTTYRYVQNTGWTNPYRALIETERTMKATDKPNKIVFMITDGQWENSSECDAIVKRMRDMGVLTVVVYLSNNLEGIHDLMLQARQGNEWAVSQMKSLNHGADIFKGVSEPKHTLALANEIVKSTITKRKVA